MKAERLEDLLSALCDGTISPGGLAELRVASGQDPEVARAVTLFTPLTELEQRRTRPPLPAKVKPIIAPPVWMAAAASVIVAVGLYRANPELAVEVVGGPSVSASGLVVLQARTPTETLRVFSRTETGWEELPWQFGPESGGVRTLRARGAGLSRYRYGAQRLRVVAGPGRCPIDGFSLGCASEELVLEVAPPRFHVRAQVAKRGTLSTSAPLGAPRPVEKVPEPILRLPEGAVDVELSFAPELPSLSPLHYSLCVEAKGELRPLGRITAPKRGVGRWVGPTSELMGRNLVVIVTTSPETLDAGSCQPRTSSYTQRKLRMVSSSPSDAGGPEKT